MHHRESVFLGLVQIDHACAKCEDVTVTTFGGFVGDSPPCAVDAILRCRPLTLDERFKLCCVSALHRRPH